MKERVFLEEFESLYFFRGNTENWVMSDFHFHKQYEILLFLGDRALLEVGKSSYHAQRGDLFLINNKEYHRTNSSVGTSHNRYVLQFDPDLVNDLCLAFGYNFTKFFENRPESFIHKINLQGELLERVTTLMDRIGDCISLHDDENKKVRVRLLLLELLLNLNEMYEFLLNDKDNSGIKDSVKGATDQANIEFKDPIMNRNRIVEIKEYIQNNIYERLELDEIATEFYISRYYLSRYFKKETGFTVVQYITNQKMLTAKKLLKAGFAVTEVAEKLSYNSDSHFIAVFKKANGVTPKQYAKIK